MSSQVDSKRVQSEEPGLASRSGCNRPYGGLHHSRNAYPGLVFASCPGRHSTPVCHPWRMADRWLADWFSG